MRLVVALPAGRATVSLKVTQVSFWLTSPHLPHFTYKNLKILKKKKLHNNLLGR